MVYNMSTKIPTTDIPSIQLNNAEAVIANKMWNLLQRFHNFEFYPYRCETIIRGMQTDPLFIHSTIKRGKIIVIDLMARHIKHHSKKTLKLFMEEFDDIIDKNTLRLIEIPAVDMKDPDSGYQYRFFPINWNYLWDTTSQFHAEKIT